MKVALNTFKKLKLIVMELLLSSILFAQVSVKVNMGTPDVRYYYLQDIEAYYDIQTSMYIYPSGNRWIRSRVLPTSYENDKLNKCHRVVIYDYHGSHPYSYFNEHRVKFPKGRYSNPENNYWSVKEYEEQVKFNKGQGEKLKGENRNYNSNRNNGIDIGKK
jgi:hypothetical protein